MIIDEGLWWVGLVRRSDLLRLILIAIVLVGRGIHYLRCIDYEWLHGLLLIKGRLWVVLRLANLRVSRLHWHAHRDGLGAGIHGLEKTWLPELLLIVGH